MAELLPGHVTGNYPGKTLRLIFSAPMARSGAVGVSGQVSARSGVLGHKSLAVSVSTGLTVSIASGGLLLQGAGATQGAYVLVNDATDTVTLDTANASLPRRDAIIARVYDATDGVSGGGHIWILTKVTGSPAASPSLPALPTDAFLLAEVLVGAGVSSLIAGNITDRRVETAALGGVIRCLSTALPTDPPPGQLVWVTDLQALDLWTGATWETVWQARIWTNLTLTPAYSNFGGVYSTFGWSVSGGVLYLRGVILSTTNTSAGATIATLPAGARPAYRAALQIPATGSTMLRIDVLTTGVISDVTAHGNMSSMLFDNIAIPLG